jgi:Predicted metal-binding protein
MLSRRDWLRASASGLATLLIAKRSSAEAPSVVTVYKDPGCECCARWVKHLSANGFVVSVRDVTNMDEVKRMMNVPAKLQSCHTAVVGRYVIEGHVPASTIKKFLASKSTALGLAAPGMPMGSPGMEGDRVDHYDILSFDRDGTSRVYEKR